MRVRNPVFVVHRLVMVLAAGLSLVGCAGVHFGTGSPDLPKPADGVLIKNAEGLPDLVRGQQAFAAGRLDDAVRDFLPLAERGYPDAAVQLAGTFVERDTLESEKEAQRWYRKVLKERPEADTGLARALLVSGDLKEASEALQLIRRAKKLRDDPEADLLLLTVFTSHPELDRKEEGVVLAKRAAASPLAIDRYAAINWYRVHMGSDNNVAILRKLCEENRTTSPNCYAELARFARYGGDATKLDGMVTEALTTFAQLATPRPETGGSSQLKLAVGAAVQLAFAMVDQLDVTDVAEIYDNFRRAPGGTGAAEEAGNIDDSTLPEAAVSVPVASATTLRTPTRPDLAEKILRWIMAQPGDSAAFATVVIGRFPYLLQDVDVAAMLRPLAAAGSHEAILQLGLIYNTSARGIARPDEAEGLLLHARRYRTTRMRANFQLARLYERGLTGKPDPQKTVNYLVENARAGDQQCNSRLARVFYGAPGFHVNRVGAYVFAKLAEDHGRAEILTERSLPPDLARSTSIAPTPSATADSQVAVRMLDRLKSELTDAEIQQAEELYKVERALQPRPRPPIPTDIYKRKS